MPVFAAALTPPPSIATPVRTLPLATMATVLAILIASWWAGRVALQENHHEDLWIYAAAARMAFHGDSPYSTERIHAAVAEQFPDNDQFINNSGFMYPPAALLIYEPLNVFNWTSAKLIWCAGMIALTALAAWNLSAFSSSTLPPWFIAAAVVVALCNWLTLFVLIVGQTPLLLLVCVILGQALHQRGQVRLGAFLWAVAFLKPHIALPLLPLAWYLNGWRRAAEIALYAGLLNVLAGLVTVGNPLLVLDYLAYIPQGHQSVEFNRVSMNQYITGWNRLLLAFGGSAIELGMIGTLLGYAVWLGIARFRMQRGSNPAWMLAVTACGMLFCCQLLPYELPLLVLVLPYLGELIVSSRRGDPLLALGIAACGAFAMMPGGENGLAHNVAYTVGGTLDAFGERIHVPWCVTAVLLSHCSLGVAGVSLLVLIRGAVNPTNPTSTPTTDNTLSANGLR